MDGKVHGSRAARRVMASCWIVLGAAFVSPAAGAQEHRVASQPDEAAPRRVTVKAANASLRSVLADVARQAGLTLVYQGDLVPTSARVTLNVTDVPVMEAFTEALTGTGAMVVLSSGDRAVVVRAGEATMAMTGGVTGRITHAVTGAPVSGAVVVMYGPHPDTVVAATVHTDRDGAYTVSALRAGSYRVIVRKLGMVSLRRDVTVTEGGVAKAAFQIAPSATQLQTLVTTGSGEVERRKVGNWITTINADSIAKTAPIRNVSDLINGRAPGVNVQATSGAVGTGSKIRIRGLSSLLTNEDPILIVDGVRMDATYTSSIFGSAAGNGVAPSGNSAPLFQGRSVPVPSRLNDIDVNSIESIDVLRGPAAATLYGSDAANGVIVIKTKRGQAGPTRWGANAEVGRSTMRSTFAESYYGWGTGLGDLPYEGSCVLFDIANHHCDQDSVTHFNPLNLRETSPFTTGRTGRYAANVSGGSTVTQYFLSGNYEDDVGMLTFPSGLRASTVAQLHGTPLPNWAIHPNVFRQLGATSTLSAQLGRVADVSLTAIANHTQQRNAQDGFDGIVNSATRSLGYRDTLTGGWGTGSPIASFLMRYSDVVTRASGALSGRWHALSYLSANATAGVDYSSRDDQGLLPTELLLPAIGVSSVRSRMVSTQTLKNGNVAATLALPVRRMMFRTNVGAQYVGATLSNVSARALGLVTGSQTINGAASLSASEFSSDVVTAGWYLEEAAEFAERLFLTAAMRQDASSAFGEGAKPVVYPKFNASWLAWQGPASSRIPGLTTLRLRGAFGQAGSQPDVPARFLTYVKSPMSLESSSTYIVNSLGNVQLQPERSQELEGGLDLGFGDDRMVLEATVYHKKTRNALVVNQLPASSGIATQVQNIGQLSNHGFELSATLRPVTHPVLTWSTTLGYSRNTNQIDKLGTATQQNGLYGRYVEGYPVDGVWARAVTGISDVNGNHIIERSEIQLTDSQVFAGNGSPISMLNWHNTIALFAGRVTVNGSVSYRGGMTQVNGMLYRQCQSTRCRGAVDPSASEAEHTLAAVAILSNTVWPFLERTSALRFDEFSVVVTAPRTVTRMARAQSATVAVLGRNLGLWTKYRGADPTVGDESSGDKFADNGGIPLPRDWSLRFTLTY